MKNFSIVIPVYNEEKLLKRQIKRIIAGIDKLKLPVKYEILLVENGSSDKTGKYAEELVNKYSVVKWFSLPLPSYGQAFKEGLKKAIFPYIFQFDIDFWDLDFIVKAQKLLNNYSFIIGSKNLNHSIDKRPFFRKMISKLLEKCINLRFNVKISDTHGLKALKKEALYPFIDNINCSNHFFDSELLIRLISRGGRFIELPVNLKELRSSRFSFLIRLKEVIVEFFTLMSVKLEKVKTRSILTANYKLQTAN